MECLTRLYHNLYPMNNVMIKNQPSYHEYDDVTLYYGKGLIFLLLYIQVNDVFSF